MDKMFHKLTAAFLSALMLFNGISVRAEDTPAPSSSPEPTVEATASAEPSTELSATPTPSASAEASAVPDAPQLMEVAPENKAKSSSESDPYANTYVMAADEESLDFSSARLIVTTDDPSVIADMSVVADSYNGNYLMQFDSADTAKEAYAYYREKSVSVQPDTLIVAAEDSDIPVDTPVENTDAGTEMTADSNPISELKTAAEEQTAENTDDSVTVQDTVTYDIALIDTGAAEGKVTAITSVLGDDGLDRNGHGSDMADFIATQNPNASILSIKALNDDGSGTVASVYAAIELAIQSKAKIINLSLAGLAMSDANLLAQAVDDASSAGIVVVGAAGNYNADAKYYTPGQIESATIIGACDENGVRREISNYGSTVDYYVKADTTSEAAASFSGALSKLVEQENWETAILAPDGIAYKATDASVEVNSNASDSTENTGIFAQGLGVGEARLKSGKEINAVIKTLVSGKTADITTVDTTVKSFQRSASAPSSEISTVDISQMGESVVIWFDSTTGAVHWYSAANTIYLSADSSHMFESFQSITSIDMTEFNTSMVTNMCAMFSGCSSLTTMDASGWNTGGVTSMLSMFSGCSSLTTLDVSNWNTDNVTGMSGMFYGCSRLTTLNVSNWNTGKVTNMYYMFKGCSSLTALDVSNWVTGNVTNMGGMFLSCSKLTALNVSKWNTSKVTSTVSMFSGCSSLTTLDVSGWNTSLVTNMNYMFYGCNKLLTLAVSNWDTSKVTDMHYMFNGCGNLTALDVSKWNTSNVTTMAEAFQNCSSLTYLDVSSWNTSKVTTMQSMFSGCSKLKHMKVGTGFVFSSTGGALPSPSATKGYHISGWYTAETGGTRRASAGGKYTIAQTEDIYAQEAPTDYHILLNNNGGTSNWKDMLTWSDASGFGHITYHISSSTDLGTASKSGYVFDGWEYYPMITWGFSSNRVISDTSSKYTKFGIVIHNSAGKRVETIINTNTLGTAKQDWVCDLDSGTYAIWIGGLTDSGAMRGYKSTASLEKGKTYRIEYNVVSIADGKVTFKDYAFAGPGTMTTNNIIPAGYAANFYADAIWSPMLEEGNAFNVDVKNLIEGTSSASISTGDTQMRAFIRSNTAPSDGTTTIDISAAKDNSIKVWTLPMTNTVYWYSKSNTVYMNADSSNMFSGFEAMQELDLSGINTANVTTASGMFSDIPRLNKITFGHDFVFPTGTGFETYVPEHAYNGGISAMSWGRSAGTMMGGQITTSDMLVEQSKTLGAIEGSWYVLSKPFIIHFDANGGSGTMDDLWLPTQMGSVPLPANKFTKDGYDFVDWDTYPGGGGQAIPDQGNTDSIMRTNDSVTLYAQWGSPKLEDGTKFCEALKKLANSDTSSSISCGSEDTNIKAFKRSSAAPLNSDVTADISEKQNKTILAWFDKTGGTIYWYSAADTVLMNEDCAEMFSRMSNLVSVDLSGFDAQLVQSVAYCFSYDSALTSVNAEILNAASDLRDIGMVFGYCTSLTSVNVSGWKVDGVTHFTYAFDGCTNLEALDISEWNVTNAESIDFAFRNCPKLSALDVSKWNTSHVNEIAGVFEGCSSLTSLDVSKWDVSNATQLSGIFKGCSSLKTIDLSGWNTAKATMMAELLSGCTNLRTITFGDGFIAPAGTETGYLRKNMFPTPILTESNHDSNGKWGLGSEMAAQTYTPDELAEHATTAKAMTGTWYAQMDGVTVTLDPNGGGGTPIVITLPKGKATPIPDPTGTDPRLPFKGWNTEKDGSGTSIPPGGEATLTEDTTLYAQWGDNPYLTDAGGIGITSAVALAALSGVLGVLTKRRRK